MPTAPRGFDLIREIKADPDLNSLPVMLVSNFPEAQTEAQTLGALAGFGKADLRHGRRPRAGSTLLARPWSD